MKEAHFNIDSLKLEKDVKNSKRPKKKVLLPLAGGVASLFICFMLSKAAIANMNAVMANALYQNILYTLTGVSITTSLINIVKTVYALFNNVIANDAKKNIELLVEELKKDGINTTRENITRGIVIDKTTKKKTDEFSKSEQNSAITKHILKETNILFLDKDDNIQGLYEKVNIVKQEKEKEEAEEVNKKYSIMEEEDIEPYEKDLQIVKTKKLLRVIK